MAVSTNSNPIVKNHSDDDYISDNEEPYRLVDPEACIFPLNACVRKSAVDARSVVARIGDKSDRATTEQCLDPRTVMILYKLVCGGTLKAIYGCVATGKEANVYSAVTDTGLHRAVKVYKTSILVFKDRDRYVAGEHRFRRGYCKSNPRKMVRLWAEKEMRNLQRLVTAGVRAPKPLRLKLHVLLMELVSDSTSPSVPAPRLKDATFADESACIDAYRQIVHAMWIMYSRCRLVHADLSEYNVLYTQNDRQCYIIDVSQSVEHDHPRSCGFLRSDCSNVTLFFRKQGVETLTIPSLYEIITETPWDEAYNDDSFGYSKFCDLIATKTAAQPNATDGDERIFEASFIPETLDQVHDFERDITSFLNKGQKTELPYARKLLAEDKDSEVDESDVFNSESESDSEASCSGSDQHYIKTKKVISKDELKEERRENKRLVKEGNRERRKTKVPKHVKKRREKVNSSRSSKS
jgi:RIO kinase 1